MTRNPNVAQDFSNAQNFDGAFSAVHNSITGRLEVGAMHRLDTEFTLPPKDAFTEQRDQLKEVYGELADYDKQNFGVRLFFLPPRHLVEFTENPEEEAGKQPKPLVEKFFRDFCGTTVKGLIRIESISENWELGITLGDWNRKETPRQGGRDLRSREEREIDEMVATITDLPSSLQEQAVDFFPLAYAAGGGVFDRPPDFRTTLLARGRPRLLTREELEELRPTPKSAEEDGRSVRKSLAYGHYIPKGERRIGGSYQEAEIVISGVRPTHQVSFTPLHKREVPFELRRRPTFISRTTQKA